MHTSLNALSKILTEEQCINVYDKYNAQQLDFLLRKGVYPYKYMDSLKRLNETLLPSRSAFYMRLNGTYIIDEEYKHAQTVYNKFKC